MMSPVRAIRYAVRFPDGRYLNGKGGGRYGWKAGEPRDASLWHRRAQATQAANWFKQDAEVWEVEVIFP
jgi:hypothetical protein